MCGFSFKASCFIHMFSSMLKRSSPFNKEHKMINESSLRFFNFFKVSYYKKIEIKLGVKNFKSFEQCLSNVCFVEYFICKDIVRGQSGSCYPNRLIHDWGSKKGKKTLRFFKT